MEGAGFNFSLIWEMVCWAIREASMLSLRAGGGVSFVLEEGVMDRGRDRMEWDRRRGMETYEGMSLTIPAIRRPWEVDWRMCSSSVVLPLLRKPEISVPGSCLIFGSLTAVPSTWMELGV